MIPRPAMGSTLSRRSGSRESKQKLKIKMKQMSASSHGTEVRMTSETGKREQKPNVVNQSMGQFLVPFGRAYTSSDDESRADAKTAKFQHQASEELINNSVLMEASNPMTPDLLRRSTTSFKNTSATQSAAVKTLAERLQKLKRPSALKQKSLRDISFKGSS